MSQAKILDCKLFQKVREVTHDGRCGARSIAVSVLGHEKEWIQIVNAIAAIRDMPNVTDAMRGAIDTYVDVSTTKTSKPCDSDGWLNSELLELYSMANKCVVVVVTPAGESRKKDYEIRSLHGDIEELINEEATDIMRPVIFLRHQDGEKFDPLLPDPVKGYELQRVLLKMFRAMLPFLREFKQATSCSEDSCSPMTSSAASSAASSPCSDCDECSGTMRVDSPVRSRVSDESYADESPVVADAKALLRDIRSDIRRLEDLDAPLRVKVWDAYNLHQNSMHGDSWMAAAGQHMLISRGTVVTERHKSLIFYSVKWLMVRELYKLSQFFAVCKPSTNQTWCMFTCLLPKDVADSLDNAEFPTTFEEYVAALRPGDQIAIKGSTMVTACGKLINVVGTFENNEVAESRFKFRLYKEFTTKEFGLFDYVTVDVVPTGFDNDFLRQKLDEAIVENDLVLDPARVAKKAHREATVAAPTMAEDDGDCSDGSTSDSDSDKSPKLLVQRRKNVPAVSMDYINLPHFTIKQDQGDVGICYNQVNVGTSTAFRSGDLVELRGHANSPADRFLYVLTLVDPTQIEYNRYRNIIYDVHDGMHYVVPLFKIQVQKKKRGIASPAMLKKMNDSMVELLLKSTFENGFKRSTFGKFENMKAYCVPVEAKKKSPAIAHAAPPIAQRAKAQKQRPVAKPRAKVPSVVREPEPSDAMPRISELESTIKRLLSEGLPKPSRPIVDSVAVFFQSISRNSCSSYSRLFKQYQKYCEQVDMIALQRNAYDERRCLLGYSGKHFGTSSSKSLKRSRSRSRSDRRSRSKERNTRKSRSRSNDRHRRRSRSADRDTQHSAPSPAIQAAPMGHYMSPAYHPQALPMYSRSPMPAYSPPYPPFAPAYGSPPGISYDHNVPYSVPIYPPQHQGNLFRHYY